MRRALLLLLAGCRAQIPPPEPGWVEAPTVAISDAGSDRDGMGTDLGEACHSLRLHGCYEGVARQGSTVRPDGQTCYERLLALEAVGIPIPARCVADAASADAIRACGTAQTLRFRCLQ